MQTAQPTSDIGLGIDISKCARGHEQVGISMYLIQNRIESKAKMVDALNGDHVREQG